MASTYPTNQTKETKKRMSIIKYTKTEEKDPKEVSEEDKQKLEQEENIKKGTVVIGFFISPLALMLLWNWLMPGIFALGTIGYLESLGLFIMSRILFKNES